jgi:TBC1 domain family member 14
MAQQKLSSVDLNPPEDRVLDEPTGETPEGAPASIDTESIHTESSSFTDVPLSASEQESREDRAQEVELPPSETPAQPVDAPEAVVDSYPAVLIDASKSPGHRVTLSTDTTTDTAGPSSSRSHSPSPRTSERSDSRRSSPATGPEASDAEKTPSSATFPPPEITEVGAAATSTSAASTSSGLTEPPLKKHVKRASGPSALERFRSKTRPAFLPPKSRNEDDKHMADWERMMEQSRARGVF